MAKIVFETDRLIVRRWAAGDEAAFFAIFGAREMYRFLPGDPPESMDACAAILARIVDGYERWNGLGTFAIVDRATGEVAGNVLLRPLEDGPEYEVGYHIAPTHWSKGFATEAARGAVAWGFRDHHLSRITGVAVPENLASCRVLEKSGLAYAGRAEHFGMECAVYVIERPLGA